MHSLEPEYRLMHAAGIIDEAQASSLIDAASGRTFNVYTEVRLVLYGSVLVIVAGVAALLLALAPQLGALAVVLGIAALAALCYVPALRARSRQSARSTAADYVLLLGALLVSADIGYGEMKFHWFGPGWPWYLLLLALAHSWTAYQLNSRGVLVVGLTALLAWFGLSPSLGMVLASNDWFASAAPRAFGCAALLWLWRALHVRLTAARSQDSALANPFAEIIEHYLANSALFGALCLCMQTGTGFIGLPLLLALSAGAIWYACATQREAFALYGVCYGVSGLCWIEGRVLHDYQIMAMANLATMGSAIALLRFIRRRIQATDYSGDALSP